MQNETALVRPPSRVLSTSDPTEWTLKSWLVGPGAQVHRHQRLALLCSRSGSVDHALSPRTGTLTAPLFPPGSPVTSSTTQLAAVSFCPHSVVFRGVCAVCGQDADATHFADVGGARAPVREPVAYNLAGLAVTRDEAESVASVTARRLWEARRLSLVLDLDHTLLHATGDQEIGTVLHHAPPDVKAVISSSVSSLELANADGTKSRMFVKFRPNLSSFLRRMADRFQLHIYTMGSRPYADKIAAIIDPDKRLFSGRITSREDFDEGRLNQKSIQRLFPCDDSMVLIVDDREDVWMAGSGLTEMPNLIRAAPYTFWSDLHTLDRLKLCDFLATKAAEQSNGRIPQKESSHQERTPSNLQAMNSTKTLDEHTMKEFSKGEGAIFERSERNEAANGKPSNVCDESADAAGRHLNGSDRIVDSMEVETNGQQHSIYGSGRGDASGQRSAKHSSSFAHADFDRTVPVVDELKPSKTGLRNGRHANDKESSTGSNATTNSEQLTSDKRELAPSILVNGEEKNKRHVNDGQLFPGEDETVVKGEEGTVKDVENRSVTTNSLPATHDHTDGSNTNGSIRAMELVVFEGIVRRWFKEDEEPDKAGHLLRLADILEQCHQHFFHSSFSRKSTHEGNLRKRLRSKEFTSPADVKPIMTELRSQILKGCHITFTCVIPTGADPTTVASYNIATRLGATCSSEFVKGHTTHLVARNAQMLPTHKMKEVLKTGAAYIVTTKWLEDSALNFVRKPEFSYTVESLASRFKNAAEYHESVDGRFSEMKRELDSARAKDRRQLETDDESKVSKRRKVELHPSHSSQLSSPVASSLMVIPSDELDAALDDAFDD